MTAVFVMFVNDLEGIPLMSLLPLQGYSMYGKSRIIQTCVQCALYLKNINICVCLTCAVQNDFSSRVWF
jgi:hypothetical protein